MQAPVALDVRVEQARHTTEQYQFLGTEPLQDVMEDLGRQGGEMRHLGCCGQQY